MTIWSHNTESRGKRPPYSVVTGGQNILEVTERLLAAWVRHSLLWAKATPLWSHCFTLVISPSSPYLDGLIPKAIVAKVFDIETKFPFSTFDGFTKVLSPTLDCFEPLTNFAIWYSIVTFVFQMAPSGIHYCWISPSGTPLILVSLKAIILTLDCFIHLPKLLFSFWKCESEVLHVSLKVFFLTLECFMPLPNYTFPSGSKLQ